MKLEYGYSKGSDRLYQKNTLSGEEDQSELYGYDALHRLTSFQRGTLNATDDAISGTPSREQAWELDHLGNWTKITSKADDVLERPYESRTHDTSHKITYIDPLLIGETDHWYYQPGYNAAGDLTDLTAANDGSPDHQFARRGLTSAPKTIYLYDGWQCVEEREDVQGTRQARQQYVDGGTCIDASGTARSCDND